MRVSTTPCCLAEQKTQLGRRRALKAIVGVAVGALLSKPAHASWPERPVKLIVPFGAGSSSDTIARIIAAQLSDKLGRQFIVENRPGGATILGTNMVAKAPPDGYTIGFANTSSHAATAAVYNDLPFDPVKDFAPVGMIGSSPFLLVGSTKLNSLSEFAALAKAQPGKLSYASAGPGTLTNLAGELIKQKLSIDVVSVPYRGTEQSLLDLISGRIDLIVATIPPVLGQIRQGSVQPFAIMSSKRDPLLPQVPTVEEAGAPGCEAGLWSALVTPAGVSRETLQQLSSTLREVVTDPSVIETLRTSGVTAETGSPERTEELIRSDILRWKRVAAEAHILLHR